MKAGFELSFKKMVFFVVLHPAFYFLIKILNRREMKHFQISVKNL